MRMKEILGEARRHPSMPSMTLKQRISPKTLNMLMHKHIYDKEIAAAKAANPDPKPEYDPTAYLKNINVDRVIIPTEYVQEWKDHKNIELALKRAVKWFNSKMPQAMRDELITDPEWQNAVLKIWDIALLYLKIMELPPSNRGGGGNNNPRRLERLLIDDKKVALNAVRNLENVLKIYRKKHNVDRFGLRLGNA